MKIKILVIQGDNLNKLNLKTDTTILLALEAQKRNQLNKSKKNETIYLNYLNQILNSNQTNAELMLSKFKEDKDLNYLYEN